MKINSAGLELIKRFEGFKPQAYLCPAGIWTIGYGCTGSVSPEQKITEHEAHELLLSKLKPIEDALTQCIKVPVNENEFSALCSLTFNIGVGAFRNSTLLKKLNSEFRRQASFEFLRWKHVKGVELAGLLNRRLAERSLFLKPNS